ncbi:MAG: lipid A deacylase LpxR family protein [Rhodobacteraceae bacterium]|nr:lipid A deacylase LpxR family protein [Paracoccaceae bacterium]
MRSCLMALCLAVMALPVQAQDTRSNLGWGRLFSNDQMGDSDDRWRTGSYGLSLLRGPSWDGTLPARAGQILEFRAFGQIIAPDNLTAVNPADRRYAGALSLGVHTHFALGVAEASVGGDLVVIGPQTQLGKFQTEVHDLFGFLPPSAPVLDNQIDNHIAPTLSGEVARSFRLGENVTLRPFVEARAGDETLIRAGGDIVIGRAWENALMLRDTVTGQRYAGIDGGTPGLSVTLGADVAHVFSSRYLPAGGAAVLSDNRTRLRAGVEWQGNFANVFYGMTYLGPEFEGQDEGQVTGSLNVNFGF